MDTAEKYSNLSAQHRPHTDEVVDLLESGQGVFGIALGRVSHEVERNLAGLPAVRTEDGLLTVGQDKRHP